MRLDEASRAAFVIQGEVLKAKLLFMFPGEVPQGLNRVTSSTSIAGLIWAVSCGGVRRLLKRGFGFMP